MPKSAAASHLYALSTVLLWSSGYVFTKIALGHFTVAKIGDDYYAVRFKVDIPKNQNLASYKDHKVSEIEIAPSLFGSPSENIAAQDESAIRGISLSVLRGEVKPSRLGNNTLFQSAFHGGPRRANAGAYAHGQAH